MASYETFAGRPGRVGYALTNPSHGSGWHGHAWPRKEDNIPLNCMVFFHFRVSELE